MVKGGWSINELGEVIQNGTEKRKSRDQGREDIIKSLIRIIQKSADVWLIIFFFIKIAKLNVVLHYNYDIILSDICEDKYLDFCVLCLL